MHKEFMPSATCKYLKLSLNSCKMKIPFNNCAWIQLCVFLICAETNQSIVFIRTHNPDTCSLVLSPTARRHAIICSGKTTSGVSTGEGGDAKKGTREKLGDDSFEIGCHN